MFTYLLGAGASIEKLPVVNQMSKALVDIYHFLEGLKKEEYNFRYFLSNEYREISESPSTILETLNTDIWKLAGRIQNSASVDTLARKYYLTGEEHELRKLKAILDTFFCLEQVRKGVDKRYDLFFATILNGEGGDISLPDNIQILTWNYDFQIELSANNFFKHRKLLNIKKELNSFPRTGSDFNSVEGFSIVKLNGSSGTFSNYQDKLRTQDTIPLKQFEELKNNKLEMELFIQAILGHYYYLTLENHKVSSYISFSWENDKISEKIIQKAFDIAKSTEHLIVIGYSFPTFNRKTDKQLLEMMNISKIYVQVPEVDFPGVRQRIIALCEGRDIKIEHVEGLNEFYIPFEYV